MLYRSLSIGIFVISLVSCSKSPEKAYSVNDEDLKAAVPIDTGGIKDAYPGIAIDLWGNLRTATATKNLPAGLSKGNLDVFVGKYSALDGKLMWSAVMGLPLRVIGDDRDNRIKDNKTIDASVFGETYLISTKEGVTSDIITCLADDGTFLWDNIAGPMPISGVTFVKAVSTYFYKGKTGAFITGYVYNPATTSTYPFLRKFDNTGRSTDIDIKGPFDGITVDFVPTDVGVDDKGGVYLVGARMNKDFMGKEISSNPYIIKFDFEGNYQWQRISPKLSANPYEGYTNIAIDSGNYIYIGVGPAKSGSRAQASVDKWTTDGRFFGFYNIHSGNSSIISIATNRYSFSDAVYVSSDNNATARYVTKLDTNLAFKWQKSIIADDLASDLVGNLYTLTNQASGPDISKYDPDGKKLF